MLPADLIQLLQTMLLALAVGCGVPSLVYLAFKGNLREPDKKQPTTVEKTEPQPVETVKETDESTVDKIYTQLPIKGTLYVPKPILREAVKEFLAEEQRKREAFMQLAKEQLEKEESKSAGKPKPQVRRVPP